MPIFINVTLRVKTSNTDADIIPDRSEASICDLWCLSKSGYSRDPLEMQPMLWLRPMQQLLPRGKTWSESHFYQDRRKRSYRVICQGVAKSRRSELAGGSRRFCLLRYILVEIITHILSMMCRRILGYLWPQTFTNCHLGWWYTELHKGLYKTCNIFYTCNLMQRLTYICIFVKNNWEKYWLWTTLNWSTFTLRMLSVSRVGYRYTHSLDQWAISKVCRHVYVLPWNKCNETEAGGKIVWPL